MTFGHFVLFITGIVNERLKWIDSRTIEEGRG